MPLDPAYPAERLAFMLEDAGVAVLLTEERLLDQLARWSAEVLCLDRELPGYRIARPSEFAMAGPGEQPGLRDLHLGIDGQAQGGAGHACRAGKLAASMRRLLSINERRCTAGGDDALVRHCGAGDLPPVDRRCPRGAGRSRRGCRRGATCRSTERSRDHISTGHARHLADVAGSRLAGSTGTHDALWRRGASARAWRIGCWTRGPHCGTSTVRPRRPSGRLPVGSKRARARFRSAGRLPARSSTCSTNGCGRCPSV